MKGYVLIVPKPCSNPKEEALRMLFNPKWNYNYDSFFGEWDYPYGIISQTQYELMCGDCVTNHPGFDASFDGVELNKLRPDWLMRAIEFLYIGSEDKLIVVDSHTDWTSVLQRLLCLNPHAKAWVGVVHY